MTSRVQKGGAIFRPSKGNAAARSQSSLPPSRAPTQIPPDPPLLPSTSSLPPPPKPTPVSLHVAPHAIPIIVASTRPSVPIPIAKVASSVPVPAQIRPQPVTAADDASPQPESESSVKKRPRPSSPTTQTDTTVSTTKSKRRKRKPSAATENDEPVLPEDPTEPLDPTITTMATLCSDTGHGRASSKGEEVARNFSKWRERMRKQRSGEAEDQPDVEPPRPQIPVIPSADDGTFDYDNIALAQSRYAPQVRIGPGGEMIIDDASLVVDRVDANEPDPTASYTHIEESDLTKFVNSGSYPKTGRDGKKKLRGSRWSKEETELFYDALLQHGENYTLLALSLPGRDRKSCKNKFKTEDKKNQSRIEYCLQNCRGIDLQSFSLMTGKDFTGPTPVFEAPIRTIANSSSTTHTEVTIADASEGDDHPKGRKGRHSRSRSRSRKPIAEEGVVIIGNMDTFTD